MNCRECGAKVEKEWGFCPRCGSRISRGIFGDFFGFDRVFPRMQKELKDMDKLFDKEVEAFDISPWFRKPVGKGFSIRISSSAGKAPRIDIKTFGDVDRERIADELRRQLGIRKPELIQTREKIKEAPMGISSKKALPVGSNQFEKTLPLPKLTEEPKTDVRRLDSGVVVDMEIPGVRSREDIHIQELENSVEVKAIAGDKAFFKILTKPAEYRLTSKAFSNGILHLEFS